MMTAVERASDSLSCKDVGISIPACSDQQFGSNAEMRSDLLRALMVMSLKQGRLHKCNDYKRRLAAVTSKTHEINSAAHSSTRMVRAAAADHPFEW